MGQTGVRFLRQVFTAFQFKSLNLFLLSLGIFCLFASQNAHAGSASAPRISIPPGLKQSVKLVPHRAVYEMSMVRVDRNSGISNIEGRMVLDFTGSQCDGYTLNMRMATNVTDKQGDAILSDLRSSTWEHGEGRRFRFNSSQYYNHSLSEVTRGDARHEGEDDKVLVTLKKPDTAKLKFSKAVLFPSQHTRFLIQSAQTGRTNVQSKLYDGSEKGKKVFFTNAFIGKSQFGASDPQALSGSHILQGKRAWPIALSFFDSAISREGETLPTYELFYKLYENGVFVDLFIDYGDFALKGKLTSLEAHPTGLCKAKTR